MYTKKNEIISVNKKITTQISHIINMKALIFVFSLLANLTSVFSLDCGDQEKFILKQTLTDIDWDGESDDSFSDTQFSFLLKSAIAYALTDFLNHDPISTDEVLLTKTTQRISGCIQVYGKNGDPNTAFTTDELIDGLSNNQEEIYRITNTTSKELSFENVYEVYEYVEPSSFEPWLVPYIIFWCIIVLAGTVMFWDMICPKKEQENENEREEPAAKGVVNQVVNFSNADKISQV